MYVLKPGFTSKEKNRSLVFKHCKYLWKWNLMLQSNYLESQSPLFLSTWHKKLALRFCTQIALCKIHKHLSKLVHELHKYGS